MPWASIGALLMGANSLVAVVQQPGAAAFDVLAGGAPSWTVVQDRPGSGDPPRLEGEGESLTVLTGAAGVFYRPSSEAVGSYRLELDLVLFDPGGRNEGFGLIFGGSNMDSAERAYSYLLLRQDGSALLKRRDGTRTPIVRDWFVHPSIRSWEARAPGTDQISNRLVIEVGPAEVWAHVNGTEILRVPRDSLPSDGVYGLRVNHGVHVRVDRFLMRELSG